MSFDPKRRKNADGEYVIVEYPNRKDHRKQYKRRGTVRSCRCHGGCEWCYDSRFHSFKMRELSAEEQLEEYRNCELCRENADILAEHNN